MFKDIHQQNLADWILNRISKLPRPAQRKIATGALQAFERAHWIPDAFQQAVDQVTPGFRISEDYVVEVDGNASEVIPRLLWRYLRLSGQAQRLTVVKAQEYLEAHELFKRDGKPYSRIGLNKAIERGQLPALKKEEEPTPYYVIELGDLFDWAIDERRHQRGPKVEPQL